MSYRLFYNKGRPVQETCGDRWRLERPSCWTSLILLGRSSADSRAMRDRYMRCREVSLVSIFWGCPEVCYDLPEGAGGKGWDGINSSYMGTFGWNWTDVMLSSEYSETNPVFHLYFGDIYISIILNSFLCTIYRSVWPRSGVMHLFITGNLGAG